MTIRVSKGESERLKALIRGGRDEKGFSFDQLGSDSTSITNKLKLALRLMRGPSTQITKTGRTGQDPTRQQANRSSGTDREDAGKNRASGFNRKDLERNRADIIRQLISGGEINGISLDKIGNETTSIYKKLMYALTLLRVSNILWTTKSNA